MTKVTCLSRKGLFKNNTIKNASFLIALSIAAALTSVACSTIFLIQEKNKDSTQTLIDILKYMSHSTDYVGNILDVRNDSPAKEDEYLEE